MQSTEGLVYLSGWRGPRLQVHDPLVDSVQRPFGARNFELLRHEIDSALVYIQMRIELEVELARLVFLRYRKREIDHRIKRISVPEIAYIEIQLQVLADPGEGIKVTQLLPSV